MQLISGHLSLSRLSDTGLAGPASIIIFNKEIYQEKRRRNDEDSILASNVLTMIANPLCLSEILVLIGFIHAHGIALLLSFAQLTERVAKERTLISFVIFIERSQCLQERLDEKHYHCGEKSK
jgi:hypothetical protein